MSTPLTTYLTDTDLPGVVALIADKTSRLAVAQSQVDTLQEEIDTLNAVKTEMEAYIAANP